MQNASLEGWLQLGGSPLRIPLDASYCEWRQAIDFRGRPQSKVRFGRWHFVTSSLSASAYEQLLELMLSATTVTDAHATYSRTNGQGQFITVWGSSCTVCHLHSHFDATGTQGSQPGWVIYFSLAAEEMGRTGGTADTLVLPVSRDYAYKSTADAKNDLSESEVINALLFQNKSLVEIRNGITTGLLPRRHADLISVEEQAIVAFYTTAEGYKDFNLALRGQIPKTPFFIAQEKLLNTALQKLPKYTSSVTRGTGEPETTRFAVAVEGDIIEYENFVSSSLDEAIADDFMYRKRGEYILRIKSKKGVLITDMSLAPAEDEILFASKSKFKVVGKSFRPRFVEDDPLIREIYLEEV